MQKEYTIRYENETYTDSFYMSQVIKIDDLIKQLQQIKKEKGNLIVLTRSFDEYGPLDNTSPILKTYKADICNPNNEKIATEVLHIIGEEY